MGRSYIDPRLTTFELVPSITFFTDNDETDGSASVGQAPLFRLEGHATHNLNPRLWVSLDGLYNYGAATTTDGVDDDNPQASLALGGTAAVTVTRHLILKATYGGVVARNDSGGDDYMIRVIGSVVF
jgi:hypothetical protein